MRWQITCQYRHHCTSEFGRPASTSYGRGVAFPITCPPTVQCDLKSATKECAKHIPLSLSGVTESKRACLYIFCAIDALPCSGALVTTARTAEVLRVETNNHCYSWLDRTPQKLVKCTAHMADSATGRVVIVM